MAGEYIMKTTLRIDFLKGCEFDALIADYTPQHIDINNLYGRMIQNIDIGNLKHGIAKAINSAFKIVMSFNCHHHQQQQDQQQTEIDEKEKLIADLEKYIVLQLHDLQLDVQIQCKVLTQDTNEFFIQIKYKRITDEMINGILLIRVKKIPYEFTVAYQLTSLPVPYIIRSEDLFRL